MVLAAGTSSRMGARKLLLPFGRGPVIRRPVRAARAAGIETIGVVAQPADDALRHALEGEPVELIENDRYADGQSTSITAAIYWASARARAVLIVLGDEPEIEPRVIKTAILSSREFPGSPIRVRYTDRPGHPVILPLPIDSSVMPEGDRGLRDFLADAIEVSVDSAAPPDIDTEADYREALARLRQ